MNPDKKYYFKENGQASKTEWINRYHFESDGSLCKNKWGYLPH
ncbi:hypothetical protein [Streptococcus sp. SK643]